MVLSKYKQICVYPLDFTFLLVCYLEPYVALSKNVKTPSNFDIILKSFHSQKKRFIMWKISLNEPLKTFFLSETSNFEYFLYL